MIIKNNIYLTAFGVMINFTMSKYCTLDSIGETFRKIRKSASKLSIHSYRPDTKARPQTAEARGMELWRFYWTI